MEETVRHTQQDICAKKRTVALYFQAIKEAELYKLIMK